MIPKWMRVAALVVVAAGFAVAVACGSETVVEKVVETVIVEKAGETVVEKVVETVIVEKAGETVEVVVTATAIPPTAIPVTVKTDAPAPKNASDTVSLLVTDVAPGVGLNRSQACDCMLDYSISENLFTPADDGTYQGPQVATAWELESDVSAVTITIRDGIQFHKDWGELTASDVAWSINDANSGTEPESIHGQAGDLQGLLGDIPVEVIDASTVKMTFVSPNVLWDADIFNEAGQGVNMLSKRAHDENGADYSRDNIVATGLYEVVEWRQDDRVVAKAFADHWKASPQVENIRILEVSELATQVAMLKTGEADASAMSLKQVPELLNSGLQAFQLPIGNIIALSFTGNLWETEHILTGEPLDTSAVYTRTYAWISPPGDATKAGEFDDPNERMENARKVREALTIAIDRDLINEIIYNGQAQPAYQVGAHPTMNEWQERWRYDYDPVLAEQLLDEAGHPRNSEGTRFEFPLYVASYIGGFNGNELGDAISGMWAEIGVTTPVLKFSYSVYRPTNVTRTSTLGWLGTFDESGIHRPFDWPKGIQMTSISRGGASSASETPYAAQRLVQGQAEPDRAERVRINTEIIDYWDHWKLIPGVIGVPCIIIYNPKSIESWEMRTNLGCGMNRAENIVPVAR